MRRLLGIAAFLGFTLFWACHLGPEDKADTLNLVGEDAWRKCHSLEVILLDAQGGTLDTLFHDSLASLDQLERLPAEKYTGGKARVRIRGFHADGSVCVDQQRTFEDGGPVVVDTLSDPDASVLGVTALPASLSLVLNGDDVSVEGRVNPQYADQALLWSMDTSGVAALDLAPGTAATRVRVSPKALGEGFLTLRSRKDPAKTARVRVHVSAVAVASVTLDNDSLVLYVGGPGEVLKAVVMPYLADPQVSWISTDPAVASVDHDGKVTPVKEGHAWVKGVSANGKADSALIHVFDDVPRLVVAAPSGVPVNTRLAFEAYATQRVGHLVQYAWDIHGDGTWDDSLAGPWFGDSVALPVVNATYVVDGAITARFRVRDSEGNVSYAQIPVEVGNQPPVILGLPGDTVISIRDSVPLRAVARDREENVAWVGWDYEGDGNYDDTLAGPDTVLTLDRGHRYPLPGNYLATFRAVDGNGKARTASVRVRVELDAPVVRAGNDTTVLVGGEIRLPVRASDGFGRVVAREFKGEDGGFSPVPEGDIILKAPYTPDTLALVVRVTDDDSLQSEDTVIVTVIMSANADLESLVPSAGTLSPAFAPGTSAYHLRLPFSDSVLTLTATARDTSAAITIADRPAASGVPSALLAIPVGSTPVLVSVISPDRSHRTYSLTVIREPNADATLRALVATGFALRPAFAPAVLQYADTVANAVASATLRPTASHPGSTILINGEPIATGTPRTYPLQYGENIFRITVVAMDTAVRTTYTVRVVRRAKLYIHRKLGFAEAVLADSAELPLGTSRPFSTNVIGFRFLRWILTEGDASFADSLANPTDITVASGTARVEAQFARQRYTITAITTGCGTVSPGNSSVVHGGQQAYTMTPNSGCRLQTVRIDGTPDAGALSGTYTFTNVTANRTLEAVFAPLGKFNLTATVAGGQGTITPASVTADSGTTHTFRFRPAANYRFLSLHDFDRAVTPNAGDTTYTLTGVSAPHQLRVRFLRRYTLTVQQSGCGSVTPGTVVVDSGSRRDFTFNPLQGCKVDSVFVNRVSAAPSAGRTFNNISRDDTLRVVFTRIYTVTTNWGTNGSNRLGGSLTPVNPQVDSLDDLTLGISPAPGHRLSAFAVGTAQISPLPTTGHTLRRVAANQTVTATFVRMFRVLGRVGLGLGTISPASAVIDSGTGPTFTFRPDSGYRYHALHVGSAPATPAPGNTQYTLPPVTRESTTVTVSFWRQYTITATAAGCGVIAGEAGLRDSNSTSTYRIRPNAGCRILSIAVDGAPRPLADTVITFQTLREDHSVTAAFESIPVPTYTIATTWGEPTTSAPGTNRRGGRLAPVDTVVPQGGSATIRIQPDPGFRLHTLRVGAATVPDPGSTYPFRDVNADQSINALFIRTFRVTTLSNAPGAVLNTPDTTLDSNSTMRLRWTTPAGYRFEGVKINNVPVAPLPAAQYDFAVRAASVCSVLFVRQYSLTTLGSPATAGTFTPASGAYDAGTTQNVTIQADDGYTVGAVRVNGTEVPPGPADLPDRRTVAVTFTGLRTVEADFVQRPVVFTVAAASNDATLGRVTPELAEVPSGESLVLDLVAAGPDYYAHAVRVDGQEVPFNSGATQFTLGPVRQDHKVEVEFVDGSQVQLVTAYTMAFQDTRVNPPRLCLQDGSWQGCSQRRETSLSRGVAAGTVVTASADESFCPLGPPRQCSAQQMMHFQYWEDKATGRQYPANRSQFPVGEMPVRLEAVYASGTLRPSIDTQE